MKILRNSILYINYAAFTIGVLIFFVFKYGETLGKFGGPGAQPGWIVKFIFSFLAALTPIASLIFQFLIWFTVVQSLLSRK